MTHAQRTTLNTEQFKAPKLYERIMIINFFFQNLQQYRLIEGSYL